MSAGPVLSRPGAAALTRADVEDFLFFEAQLLDEWRLDEWEALLAEDATHPTTGPAAIRAPRCSRSPTTAGASPNAFCASRAQIAMRNRRVRAPAE